MVSLREDKNVSYQPLKKGKETDKFATLANGCLKYIS
jgi:hypothetical protein